MDMEKEKDIEAECDGDVYFVLKKMSINPETVLIFIKNKPVPDDFVVKKGEKIRIMEITSSG